MTVFHTCCNFVQLAPTPSRLPCTRGLDGAAVLVAQQQWQPSSSKLPLTQDPQHITLLGACCTTCGGTTISLLARE